MTVDSHDSAVNTASGGDPSADQLTLADRLLDWLPYLALVVASTAFLGSLYYSEVRGFTPCALCWYQRILMYPIPLILIVGLLRRDSGLPLYVLPLALLGLSTSSYHVLLQKTDLFTSSTACSAGVPCSVQYINLLGFVTIPMLAGTAFLLIILSMFSAWRDADVAAWAQPGRAPWVPVAVTVGAVVVYFALIWG